MRIIDSEIDQVQTFPPGTAPNYDKNNPIWRIVQAVEGVELAADREHYLPDTIHHLFPIRSLAPFGPSGDQWQVRDPRQQDNKNDFQKQNIRELILTGTQVTRGFAQAGEWIGSFLHISYVPSPDSPLLGPDGLYRSDTVRLVLRIGSGQGQMLTVPYNTLTDRYEIELWAIGDDFSGMLGPKGMESFRRGALLGRPDLVRGGMGDFRGTHFDNAYAAVRYASGLQLFDYVPDHTMHPLRPLHVELAWNSADGKSWDSKGGANYHYEFCMSLRGWHSYLGIGVSDEPHGGVGKLEYRNLYSNYFGYESRRREVLGNAWSPELGRSLQDFNFDADGRKPSPKKSESFLAVDYMDLHILEPGTIIGIHRHRDNQEVFFLMQGKALMLTGDWEQLDGRDRAIEVRPMLPGDLVLIKGGQMHSLVNVLDKKVLLFTFGGYD
jgi:hypothetical protein